MPHSKPATNHRLLSWGGLPRRVQHGQSCHWRDEVPGLLASAPAESLMPWGAGRSYGDCAMAVSDRVLMTASMDRFLAADWTHGRVVVGSGMSIQSLLRVAMPRGWFVPVTPGTQYVTIGGAVANDVHGKNHQRGATFGAHVLSIGMIRSDRGQVTCSPTEDTQLFSATIGGLGLTGIITWVELQLMRIPSSSLDAVDQRFSTIEEFLDISRENEDSCEFSVAWVDCCSRSGRIGRGIHSSADFAPDAGPPVFAEPSARRVPLDLPFSVMRPATVRAFNSIHWRRVPSGGRRQRVGFQSFFYPLDGIDRWNRLYGPRGLRQFQCVVPTASQHDAIGEMLQLIARADAGSMLAVLKTFGTRTSPGWLSFPMAGTTLAMDFPDAGATTLELFDRLSAVVRSAGGRLYAAKDSCMAGADFRAAYPAWPALEALRDPALMSRFWERVTR